MSVNRDFEASDAILVWNRLALRSCAKIWNRLSVTGGLLGDISVRWTGDEGCMFRAMRIVLDVDSFRDCGQFQERTERKQKILDSVLKSY